MKILEISTETFDDILEETLKENIISHYLWSPIFSEVATRTRRYVVDAGEGPVMQRNLHVILGDILIILRNNYVDEENESFVLESLAERFEKHIKTNPYL